MIQEVFFGRRNFGFGDGRHSLGRKPIEYYYSIGMKRGLFGLANGYSVVTAKSSDDIATLGSVKWWADANGILYGYDDAGNILKEGTPGAANFAISRAVGAGYAGQGLIGDQKGRLLYFGATAIGMLAADGTTYTDNWKTGLTSYDHPADTYEDMVIFGNKNAVALLSSTDTPNLTALNLPSAMTVDCLKAGTTGILIGANLGYRGVLILWNTQTDRSLAPWIWTKGKVQSIERTDSGWIVVTQKQILFTNGYSAKELFPILDDPMGYNQYTVAAQGTLVNNGKLFILNQNGGFGRQKPGIIVFDLGTQLSEFVPLSTGNTHSATALSIYSYKSVQQEIVVGFKDLFLNKTYISRLFYNAASSASYVSEVLADTSTEKVAEAVILNVGVSTGLSTLQPLTFTVSLKLYDFKRPLWGFNVTTAISPAANQIRVNGASANVTKARVTDEVTILEGLNAGQVRHITSIANDGATNELWTLDSALPNVTENGVNMNVQPFQLISSKKVFTTLAELKELYFDAKQKMRAKKYLVKVVIEGLSNTELEIHPSLFVYDDIGITT